MASVWYLYKVIELMLCSECYKLYDVLNSNECLLWNEWGVMLKGK